jgi:hypothetical protein
MIEENHLIADTSKWAGTTTMEATMELSKTPNMSDPLDISNHPDIHYLSMYRTTHYSFSLEVVATQPLNPIKLLMLFASWPRIQPNSAKG